MFYRVKQFYWTLTSKVDDDDRSFVKLYLNDLESDLFYKLSVSDQKHSIRVAKDIKSLSDLGEYDGVEIDWVRLIKSGLLHDVGKIKKPLNFFDKSLLVILDWVSNGNMKRFTNIHNIYIYYYHAEESFSIMKDFTNDSQLLFIIKNHHNKNIKDNIELNILRKFDDMN